MATTDKIEYNTKCTILDYTPKASGRVSPVEAMVSCLCRRPEVAVVGSTALGQHLPHTGGCFPRSPECLKLCWTPPLHLGHVECAMCSLSYCDPRCCHPLLLSIRCREQILGSNPKQQVIWCLSGVCHSAVTDSSPRQAAMGPSPPPDP